MRNAIQPGTPDITWFPKGKAMCLKAGASDESVYDHINNLQVLYRVTDQQQGRTCQRARTAQP